MPVMSSYGFSSSERETILPINAWSLDHEEFNGRKTTTTVIILHVFVFKSWLGSNFNGQEITKLMFWALALCRLVPNRIRSWRFEREPFVVAFPEGYEDDFLSVRSDEGRTLSWKQQRCNVFTVEI